MAKLSGTHSNVLAAAAARDDGYAVIPATMKPAAATKLGSSLVDRKLFREMRSKPGMPVWYADEKGRNLTLVITATGRKAVAVEKAASGDANAGVLMTPTAGEKSAGNATETAAKVGAETPNVSKCWPDYTVPNVSAPQPNATTQITLYREGSKSALLVKMLSAKDGVTLQALEDATGWLPHTMRAALTGLRKKGFVLARDRQPGKHSIYRIADQATATAA